MAGQMQKLSQTRIGTAIVKKKTAQLKYLLETENPYQTDNKGNTFLHLLATTCYHQGFYLLASTGIDINHQNKDGNTVLHITALSREPNLVTTLFAYGVDPYIRNNNGKLAEQIENENTHWRNAYNCNMPGLWAAVQEHDIFTVKKLLNNWCRCDIAKVEVSYIHGKRNIKLIKSLRQLSEELGYHGITELLDKAKFTQMMLYGVLEQKIDDVKYALDRKPCDVNLLNQISVFPHILHYAIQEKQIDVVKLLCTDHVPGSLEVHAVVDVNTIVTLECLWKGPLYFEVLKPGVNSEIIDAVLNLKPNMALRDELGRSALSYCLDRHDGEIDVTLAKILIDLGLDISMRDVTGATVCDVAKFARCLDIVQILEYEVVEYIRSSNVAELERLAVMGFDGFDVTYMDKDSHILASGNETGDVLNFLEFLPKFKEQSLKLHLACQKGDVQAAETILNESERRDMLICTRDKGERTPLMLAVLFAQQDMVEFLLSKDICGALKGTDCCGRNVFVYGDSLGEQEGRNIRAILDNFRKIGIAYRLEENMNSININSERKRVFEFELELRCLDKYEELKSIIDSQDSTVKEFSEALKYFKFPVVKLDKILQPRGVALVKHFKHLLQLAIEAGKEDIAIRLIDGKNSQSQKGVTEILNALEAAQVKGMNVLVDRIQKRLAIEDRAKS